MKMLIGRYSVDRKDRSTKRKAASSYEQQFIHQSTRTKISFSTIIRFQEFYPFPPDGSEVKNDPLC